MTNKEMAVLVRKVQKDKESHFEELYKEIWNTVYYYCYKSLGNEQDASDAMQTVFLNLYNKFDTLYHPKAFNEFLNTMMTYTCYNFYKSKSRNDADEIEAHDFIVEDKVEFLPSEAYERQDVKNEIAKMVETLPEKQREAILLFYYNELSIKEIAEITDGEVASVKNRLFKARKSLKERADILIKEGALNYVMAILPVPILTKILQEEAQALATPEVCEAAWQGICASIGIVAAGAAGAAAGATSTTTASTSTATNVAIGLTCAAVIAAGGFLAYYAHNNFVNPPPIEEEYQYEEPYETDENDVYFESLIRPITTRDSFEEFVDEFEFTLLEGTWSADRGTHMLYYLELSDSFIYVGYIEHPQDGFRVVYQTTPNRLFLTGEQIVEWLESL